MGKPILNVIGANALEETEQADLAIIPTGSIEYHGPHAALGTDSFIAQELGERVTARLNAVLYPLIPYTTCPVTTRPNPGTVSIDSDVMVAYLECIFRQIYEKGFKALLVLNAHDGNIDTVRRAAERVYFDYEGHALLLINFWQTLPTPVIESLGLFSHGGGHGHGGPLETSAAWAVAPDTVDLSKAADIDEDEEWNPMMSVLVQKSRPQWAGYGGRISESSIEKGQAILKLAEDRIVALVDEWLKKG